MKIVASVAILSGSTQFTYLFVQPLKKAADQLRPSFVLLQSKFEAATHLLCSCIAQFVPDMVRKLVFL